MKIKEKNMFSELSLKDFVASTASDSPVPGGGSVAAYCASIGTALMQMVAGLTVNKKNYEHAWAKMQKVINEMPALQDKFLAAIDTDTAAFDGVMNALHLPKDTDENKAIRRKALNDATVNAAKVPLELAQDCVKLFPLCDFIATNGNKNAISDIAVATMLLRTAVLSALYNVKINLNGLGESEFKTKTAEKVAEIEAATVEQEKLILGKINL